MDLLFDESRIALCERARGSDYTACGELLELHFIVAGRCAAHGDEEHRETRHARDLLGTHVEGRVATEEMRPVLVLAGGRLLVSHHGHGAHHVATLEDVREQILGRHQAAAEAHADLFHLALRPLVHQRLVGCIDRVAELDRQREQHPLPVTLVSRYQQHRLTLREQCAWRLEIQDVHPPPQLLGRHPHGLDDLHQHLREAEVIGAHHRAQLRLVEGGEGLGEVLAYHVLAVGKETERQPAGNAREPVQRRERHARQQARPPHRTPGRGRGRGRGGRGTAVVSANLGEHSALFYRMRVRGRRRRGLRLRGEHPPEPRCEPALDVVDEGQGCRHDDEC